MEPKIITYYTIIFLFIFSIVYLLERSTENLINIKNNIIKIRCTSHRPIPINNIIKINKLVKNQTPFVIKNGAKLLKAYNKWSDSYLRNIIGEDKFYVEKSYSNIFSPDDPNSKAGRVKMTFNKFSKKYIHNNFEKSKKKHLNYYFAEVSVPDKLLKDVKNPFYEVFKNKPKELNMFLGVGGNVTRTHHDSYDNFYFLIDGSKEFSLISPEYNDKLYIPKQNDGDDSNYLNIDIENIDYKKYPLMKEVPIIKVKLEKGDVLYIPDDWWHHVKSGLARNLAISFWY
jgi:hypothetical protein